MYYMSLMSSCVSFVIKITEKDNAVKKTSQGVLFLFMVEINKICNNFT